VLSTNPNFDSITPGSGVGTITATNGIDPTFVAGGSIGATTITNGTFSGTKYIALDSSESGTGIGAITVTLGLGSGSPAQAISSSSLFSVGNVGAISGTVQGDRGYVSTYVAGISNLSVTAIGTVGAITGENDAFDSNGYKTSGIYGLELSAGGVGNVLGEVVDSGTGPFAGDNAVILGFGIRDSSIFTGSGGVGSVSGNTSSTTVGSYAMESVAVVTSGSISSTGAVTGVGIEATGEIIGSLFEAGTGPTEFGTTVTAGGKIGTVTINSHAGHTDGALASTSIVASVGTSNDYFGSGDSIAHGGAIGAISIADASEAYSTVSGSGAPSESYGIEAATIGAFTIGNTTETLPGVLNGNTLVSNGSQNGR
jgi:hypothetical protein